VLGIAAGRFALTGLVALAPKVLTQSAQIAIDWRIVLFAVGLSLLTGILFGLVPSMLVSKTGIARHSNRGSERALFMRDSPAPF